MSRHSPIAKAGTQLDHALDALYSESPVDFTAERDALVRKLKAEGDRDAAARSGRSSAESSGSRPPAASTRSRARCRRR